MCVGGGGGGGNSGHYSDPCELRFCIFWESKRYSGI